MQSTGSICIFLGEDSDTWNRPIPEDKTIHVNVFTDPETGEIEYFRHNMPFHMQLHINHKEDQMNVEDHLIITNSYDGDIMRCTCKCGCDMPAGSIDGCRACQAGACGN